MSPSPKINAEELRLLLDAASHLGPWCVYPPSDPMGAGIGAAHTKYNIGGFEDPENDLLAVAAVNALPALLAVYEAACRWRADRGQGISTVDYSNSVAGRFSCCGQLTTTGHARGCAMGAIAGSRSDADLVAAIDAARGLT